MQVRAVVLEQDEQRGVVRVQQCFRWGIAAFALLDCWICRFKMNPDGVSYLDMGDYYWKGNWHAALNPYWSPLYGWMTGLMFRVTKPSMRWEYPEVHLLNFAIFVATLFCFEIFWRELLAWKGDNAWMGASRPYAWALGYLLFACILFGAGMLALVSPDLLVAALVLVASGMMLRFASGLMGTTQAALMGAVLGVGYLAKAAMLPFAVVVMMTMLAVTWRQHGRKWMIGATLLGFLVISIPFIAALSYSERQLTFGESAKINYGWCVNGVSPIDSHWQGDGPGHSGALHPTRKIFGWPEVYEFATPVAGTYPVWYDPSYWYAGLDSRVHPVREVKAFLNTVSQIEEYFLRTLGFLTTVVLMMFLLSDRIKDSWWRLMEFWPIMVPAVAVFLMYAMVHWEMRYTSGVMLVGCGAVMASMSISEEERRLYVLQAASLMLGAMMVCWVLPLLMLNGSYRDGRQSSQQIALAERLRTMGFKPGDQVALIGNGFGEEYWARLEKVRIVAEVPNLETGDSTDAYWNSSPETERAVLNVLKSIGAKAVIADTPPRVLPPGWTQIDNTGHAVYFFR
jgi:hypothetical protein